LFNLSEINLSFNDFVCDCNLSWLPAWINSEEAKGVNVVDSEFIKCAKPSKFEDLSRPFSLFVFFLLPQGSEYMACLSDKKSIVSLSLLTLWNSSRENCTALCFAEDELYAALDSDNQCLCGSSLEPDSIALCTQEKTGGQLSPACGCTVVKEAFQVTIANFAELRTFSLYELARLTVVPLVHVSTFQWDFGDLSPLFNTTDHVVLHKYSLPGTYLVSVTLFVGHRVISLHVEIQVTVHPGRMELTCPPVVQTQESIGIGICNWDSLNVTALWSITTPNDYNLCNYDFSTEMPSCSLGGYLTNSRCYKLVNKSSTWSKARHFCQSHTGGDLAILKDLEVQTFLLNVTEWRPVWIGLSDTVSAGTLQWVDGSILEHYHNWLPGEPNMLLNNTCVLMGVNHAGQWRAGLCNTKRRFICEYRPGGISLICTNIRFIWSKQGTAEISVFLKTELVTNLFVHALTLQLMVFPGLWFGHKGFVSALEFATQSLNSTVQIRFQIYRPRCVGTDLRLVTPGNGLIREGNKNESIPVQSNDIIAIQHDGEPGSFLQCQQDPSSPWQKRYFSIITLNGTRDVLRDLTDVSWSDSTVCNLRVLYTRRQETIAKSPLIQNAPHSPGLYTYQSTMENVFFPTNLSSCTIKVVAPIRFLRVIHPKEQNGVYFVPRNQTVIIVQINSWGRSVTCWAGSNQTFPCQAACPLELSSDTYKCERVTNDTCFSRFPITFTNCTQMTIVISAKNEVSSINKTVTVKSEELIQGLRVMPDPKLRVLSNTLVSYTAVVTAGTDITFKWNIDDNPSFTNYKQVFNVIYCNEAVYKLSLTASNHVNGDVVTYNVTVYKRNPLADLCVSGIPAIAVRDSPCTFTGSVTVDAAVNATFRWSYGDGSPDKIFDFRSPYNHSDMVQLLSDEQVVLQQNATHTYQSPGDYNLTVTVSDKYENISRHLLVRVCNLLTNVTINMDSDVIAVDQRVQFEAVPWPATQGITYTWHFSDNLAPLNGTQQRVNHTFRQSGKYNVSVRAHNAISSVEAGRPVGVLEQVVQLSILASSPTELSSPTIVTASSERGTDISWTFDMGDGTPLVETRLAMVNHTYAAVGNYMLSVTATNPLGAVSASHLVHVFVLQVCRIEPSECVQELVEVSFRAFTPGDPAKFVFSWDFGDGSPNVTVPGDPTAKHNYTRSSPFLLTLSVSSSVNKVNFYSNMCVQSAISLVVLTPLSRYVKLGEESVFRADVFPESQQYTYVWDLEGMEAQQAHGREMNVTFRTPGLHTVNVTVFNNVSSGRNTSSVEIQAPVRLVRIKLREATFATDLVLGRTYAFTAQSEGDRAEYGWDFGDGRRESGVNASHSYCAPGRFVVVLTVRNMVSSEEATLTITVKTPIAGLRVTANTSTTPVNMPVGFVANHTAGDHVNYLWSFCNSCSLLSEPATVFYTFISPGLFNVSVTAKNGISTGQASILVFVLKEIKGLKMILPNLVEDCCFATEQTLQMQLVIREGTNVSYKWTVLSEGVTVFQCMENDTKACFSEPGTYHIVLQASNLLGSLSVNRSVLVMERVDGVELRAEPEPVAVGTTANISASLHAGTNVTYVWSLGGNFTIPTLRPFVRHRFQSPGLKHINVTVTNKLGSSSGTLAIRVQEPVTGLTINTGDPSSQCYVATNTTLILRGSVHSGTNISWIWMLWNTEERTQQEITLSFASAGVYEVSLNASNDVSCDMAVKRLIVQDTVRGLQLEASKWTVAPREELIFTVRYSSGTDLILSLSFGNSLPVLLNNTSYSYSFRELGPHTVRLRAENRVSSIETSLVIQVIEPIAGLRLRDQNVQAIPAGVLRTFGAVLSKGSQVSYTWDFELGGLNKTLHGQNVSYTPKAQGQLKVFLSAFNNISRENVSIVILVQEKILSTRLTVIPLIAVVKETVYLNLSRTPSSSQASFEWKFGDGSQDAFTKESVKTHLYSRPGEYEVEVNASNSVSFLIAKVKVIVVLLKCDPPKIHLVLSDTMKSAERNYLEAEIDLKGCAEYQIEYLWDIYKALRCETFQQVNKVELGNVDLTRPQLLLPRQALQIGNYCVNFSISFSGTSYSKSTFSVVTLIPSPLVPIIDGGTARSWSPTQDLILDGTESYDLDQPIESQTPLNYNWFCICSWKEPSKCNISGNGAVFYIPSHRLEDTKYTCHLTVSKPNREPQSISMKNGTSPLVSLECISCKAQSVHGVSRSSHIILSGSCSNCHWSSQYAWEAETFNKIPLVLNSTTTTTGSTEMNLVVRHRVLQDGVGYTFSLNVIDPLMENVGFASIYIPPMYPPSSGNCQIYPTENISALTTSVTFTCTGWKDTNDTGAPLVYSFILTRCKSGGNQCNEFYVYRGSRSEYSAVLPPGFRSNHFIAYIAVIVETQQGAAAVAINKSVVINITDTPEGFQTLTDWMKLETETKLQDLLKQGDPQPTIEYALALITVLNERIRNSETELRKPETEWGDDAGTRIDIRSNITLALTSLKVTTVDDTQQISAALAQCTVISREFICRECQKQTLFAVDNMISVLQKETGQGKMTPTSIADNILVTAGEGRLNQFHSQFLHDNSTCSPELMATEAYNLSVKLMQVLMDTRVLNEEPLSVRGNKMVADGKRADRYNLLCFDKNSSCQFSIPHSFSRVFTNISDVTQVLFLVDSNPFPYGYIENYTVSSKVASIEFRTDNGTHIPIENLNLDRAVTVKVSTRVGVRNTTVNTTVINGRSSVTVNITSGNLNKEAGLHIQVTYTLLNGVYYLREANSFIHVLLHNSTNPNESNFKTKKRIDLESVRGSDHKLYTFFLSPDVDDTTKEYYLNITNYYSSSVRAAVGVYTSLCQYFNTTTMSWQTDGIVPLEDTTPDTATCLTQHLTAFGASLFVPPNSVVFINPPTSTVVRNYVVLITCSVCFVIYAVSAFIVRKLDQIDIKWVGFIPFCGIDGYYKYEILVKTGWGRGSGTTSHVGISLYGKETKSGHRHLDNQSAFRRNGLDVFQIATGYSLGRVWKIRVWHDNRGLSPSWYLQHVIIKDLQTNESYYFLVNDWLSVDNDRNRGLVEKEVLMATEAELKDFGRIFIAEIQQGLSEKHIWLSVWDRHPRSRFTRVQRVTCCLVLIYLVFCAGAVWYGIIRDINNSDVPIATQVPLSGESMAAGVVSSVIVYPVYLFVVMLYRMSRSQVSFTIPPLRLQFLALSLFPLSFGAVLQSCSLSGWQAYDGVMNWPDLLNDRSIMGSSIPKLKRGRATRHLGIETPLCSEEEPSSFGFDPVKNICFSTSDEQLIERILTDGSNAVFASHTIGQASLVPESVFSFPAAFSEPPKKCLFPSWCSYTAHVLSFFLFSGCISVSVWIGINFTASVSLMWLISGIFSILCSFFLLEPLKVLTEALYFAMIAKRVHPDEDDNLVERPRVELIAEKIGRVRPPQGYGLLQAKEEAKKVHTLHKMLKNFIIYMLFLLVVLLINYGDSFKDGALQSLCSRSLHRTVLSSRSGELWKWMAEVLLPYLYSNKTGSLLGCPRLRQVRSKEGRYLPKITTHYCSSKGIDLDSQLWKRAVVNRSTMWPYSEPDPAGVWYWGQIAVYDSGGYTQKLARTKEESSSFLWDLQKNNWLDGKTRAVFIEFTQFYPNVDLYAVGTLLIEFPVSGGVFTTFDVSRFPLLQLSAGADLLLVMMVSSLRSYTTLLALTALTHRAGIATAGLVAFACCVAVHLWRAKLADRQWLTYRAHPDGFPNFYHVASLSYLFTSLAALLLFLLTIKTARQVRFIRQWSIFGKTLNNSGKELRAMVVTFIFFLLAYTQLGYLVGVCITFGSSMLSLLAVIHRGVSLRQSLIECPRTCYIYYISYMVIEIWVVLRLFAAVLIQNYRSLRLEMHRPAFEPQDYEMVDLFLRRLKIWIGMSKVKEFRHKVRFEGMVPLPSRSSRDSKSSCLHTASTVSDISMSSTSTISIPVDTFHLARPNEAAEIESNILRLVPIFESLLEQFDRVNQITEDIYQLECKLQDLQGRIRMRKRERKTEEPVTVYSDTRVIQSPTSATNEARHRNLLQGPQTEGNT
uniref:Polycystin 1, transient receptor potential channel interacting n=1 Tax=Callorhinchus milii TaxID=7868 RepID=A0A4W3IKU7_CALMI